ncbi:protein of unknown function [Pseudodesulfovibrio piezophilus C1TLV30]|uniref:Uncharacterized protein n=1 Tax=Pseudodesulfovibrio piezophilus (strain DSM 21447 / JCM 15486 / C1TLV30) TaxID=1322246 RepID=M1WPD6_PSEP2|nr:protein of unknown function [Pseudodesulfovibrio piezophilus C1TLV30]
MPGCFYGEVRYRFVGQRMIIDFFTGYALFIDEDQPFIGKNEEVANNLVRHDNAFPRSQDGVEVVLHVADIHFRGIAENLVNKSHENLRCNEL